MDGKIKWYKKEKGYGFIVGTDGKDYFTHYSEMPQNQEDVRESDDISVTFDVKDTERGPQASNIKFGSNSNETAPKEREIVDTNSAADENPFNGSDEDDDEDSGSLNSPEV